MSLILRTVPTKYKGYCARLGPLGKSRSLKGYWNPQRKIWVATHFCEIISLESQQKCRNAHISIFLKKEGKVISSQISLEFALLYRKANTFKKIFKLHGNNGNIEIIFGTSLTLFRLGGMLFEPPLRQNRDNFYTERATTFKFSDFS